MSFHPYLFFSGNCAEAFDFYGSVFGSEPQVMKNSDLPPGQEPMGDDPNSVMHASVSLRDGHLMGSDDPTGDGGPKVGFSVAYTATDPDDAKAVFSALSDGGAVIMAPEPTFWSPMFGMLTDKFGVSWMIDTQAAAG